MADITEKTGNGELVANCDRLQNDEVVVTTPVESRIMSIRGNQIMIDRDLAELVANCDQFNSLHPMPSDLSLRPKALLSKYLPYPAII